MNSFGTTQLNDSTVYGTHKQVDPHGICTHLTTLAVWIDAGVNPQGHLNTILIDSLAVHKLNGVGQMMNSTEPFGRQEAIHL
jgi:hypothetical protein